MLIDCGRYWMDTYIEIFEDELPEMSDEEYNIWYVYSFLDDGVRIGSKLYLKGENKE